MQVAVGDSAQVAPVNGVCQVKSGHKSVIAKALPQNINHIFLSTSSHLLSNVSALILYQSCNLIDEMLETISTKAG